MVNALVPMNLQTGTVLVLIILRTRYVIVDYTKENDFMFWV